MPNPKLETYKNKATSTVYDLTDANAQASLTAILDGTSVDSFADVESALAGKFPREEQRVLGAKQWFNNAEVTAKTGATITKTETGFTSVVSSASWCGAEWVRRVPENTDFDLTLESTITSGVTYIAAQGSTDGSNYTNIKTSAVLTASGSIDLSFNTGNYTYLKIIFYTTNGTVTACNVTLSNILLTLASDTDRTFAPFAMTNKELTEKVTPVDGTITSTYTIATGSTYLKKTGNIVNCQLRVTGVTAEAETALATIPQGFRPITDVFVPITLSTSGIDYATVKASSGNITYRQSLSNVNLNVCACSWIVS